MNIINKLTVRHLARSRSRTLMTIFGIVLSVAMVCAVSGFVMSLRTLLRETIIESRGDYHIAYLGVTEETAGRIAGEEAFATYYQKDNETGGLVDIYLRLETPGRDYWDVAEAVADKYGAETAQANTELLALEGAIAQDNVLMPFIIIGAIAIVIIVVGSIIVIANAFYISTSERVRQFGLLKSAGATKKQIGRSILFEAFLLAVVAIPLGIALGFLIQAVVLRLVNGLLTEINELNTGELAFHVVFSPAVIYISAATAALTVLISAWLPARRAAKTSPIDAIRQTKDIRIRSKQLKASRLTGKLFGFEGTLASKSLKRSRGKYRATVVSLTISIVLLVSISSLIHAMNKGVEMEYGGYDFDVLVTVLGNMDEQDSADTLLSTIPDVEISSFQYMLVSTTVPDDFYTERMQEYYRELHSVQRPNDTQIALVSMPDDAYSELAPISDGQISGVLINTTGVLQGSGKLMEFTPHNFTAGTELPLRDADAADPFASITLSAETRDISGTLSRLLLNDTVNILIPESVFRGLLASREAEETANAAAWFAVTTADPDTFCETAEELLLSDDGDISIWNLAQMTRLNRNITLIVMLFGYGFIGMLSLIAVISVFTTISTSMALRRQEFAMLHSAGMTRKGMNKMLNLESLLYGLKSIFIGLPIGTALSYLMHRTISGLAEFPYQPPWNAMIISAAAVLLLTFSTMHYSKIKLNKVSIIEAIRGETV